jgi:hypothetical protein
MCGDPKKRMREVVFLEVAIGILGKRCEKEVCEGGSEGGSAMPE